MKALRPKCSFNPSPAPIDVVNFGKSAMLFIVDRPVCKMRVEHNGQKDHFVRSIGIFVLAEELGVVVDIVDYVRHTLTGQRKPCRTTIGFYDSWELSGNYTA